MPSPIAHTAVAYALWRGFGSMSGASGGVDRGPLRRSFLAAAVLCLLPDLPSIYGLLTGQLGRYHNNWEHSLVVGVAVGLLCGVLALGSRSRAPWRWLLLGLLCYQSHVLMDSLTVGRGVMLFWPFETGRVAWPVRIFYGLHWSDGWLSTRHLITLATEVGFGCLVLGLTRRLLPDSAGASDSAEG